MDGRNDNILYWIFAHVQYVVLRLVASRVASGIMGEYGSLESVCDEWLLCVSSIHDG